MIDGKSYDYFGQLSPPNPISLPDGLGLAINQHNHILEGAFSAGTLEPTYREIVEYDDGYWLWDHIFNV